MLQISLVHDQSILKHQQCPFMSTPMRYEDMTPPWLFYIGVIAVHRLQFRDSQKSMKTLSWVTVNHFS